MKKFFILTAVFIALCFAVNGAAAPKEFEAGVKLVSTDELKAMIDRNADMTLIHTLSPLEFNDRAIPGSVNIPYEYLKEGRISLPEDKETTLVFYCLGFK